MIPALFALAAAMLIAGVTAVVEGFPYVRLESGMAMVYGGSVVGSSGILLFGLAVVATWLKRIETALRDGPFPLADDGPRVAQEVREPGIDGLNDGPASSGMGSDRPRIEPSLVLPPSLVREREAAEPELPLPGLTAPAAHRANEASLEATPDAAKADAATAADDLFVPPRPGAVQPEPTPGADAVTGETALRSSLDTAPEAAAAPKSERTVVGRYSSGGNTYMMFDDGAIEADTPNGRFTFASLDELKAFVDGGGEAGTRGAA
ncbi:hypothetical protein [Methylobacterium sp. J-076]|uniref:hypothetical protein n=1 Tax=Methylobacterium sp. J-076 TaxID=2836655 RepID=UPI001FBBDEFB|nr:hypothetical protein [Methylobacterium sp. J-076]MCJ2011333.1 hypothetical protein [Methylobacterium sp. J-076]